MMKALKLPNIQWSMICYKILRNATETEMKIITKEFNMNPFQRNNSVTYYMELIFYSNSGFGVKIS